MTNTQNDEIDLQDCRAILKMIIEDGYLSETNMHRGRRALDLTMAAANAARNDVLEEAAQVCDVIASDKYDQYKGRGKHAPNNPNRADTYTNGESDGAGECAEKLRKMKTPI